MTEFFPSRGIGGVKPEEVVGMCIIASRVQSRRVSREKGGDSEVMVWKEGVRTCSLFFPLSDSSRISGGRRQHGGSNEGEGREGGGEDFCGEENESFPEEESAFS